MVPITITGRSEKITHAHKEHAREKIQKLERYFGGITRIEAILDNHQADAFRAELVISIPRGSQIVVHCDDKELHAAIDLVLDKAEIQLTRRKERIKEKRPAGTTHLGAFEAAGNPTGEEKLESYQEIIEKETFE